MTTSSLLQPLMLRECRRGHCSSTYKRGEGGKESTQQACCVTHDVMQTRMTMCQCRMACRQASQQETFNCQLHPHNIVYTAHLPTFVRDPQLLRSTCVRLWLCTSTYSRLGQLLRVRTCLVCVV